MADRHGQSLVLVLCGFAASLPLVAMALVSDATPIPILGVLAAPSGVLHPPLSGCMRALWSTLAFATAPSSRRWRPEPPAGGRSIAGALASPALLVLLAGMTFMGASFGAIELAVTAFAEEEGSSGLAGPLLGAWALGSLLGGLVVARSGASSRPARRVLALLLATAVADAVLVAAPSPGALALALVLAGSFIAPAFATLYGMVPRLARAGTLTESYTWLTTGISIGVAVGSALAGSLVAAGSSRAGLAVAAALMGLGALSLAGGRHRLGWRASVAAAA
jgi:predicted MFS family arabinose efflux permease